MSLMTAYRPSGVGIMFMGRLPTRLCAERRQGDPLAGDEGVGLGVGGGAGQHGGGEAGPGGAGSYGFSEASFSRARENYQA